MTEPAVPPARDPGGGNVHPPSSGKAGVGGGAVGTRVRGGLLVAVAVVLAGTKAVPLAGQLRANSTALRVVSALPLSGAAAESWRGAGADLADEDSRALIVQANLRSPELEACSARDRRAVARAVSLLPDWDSTDTAARVKPLVRAREQACADRPDEALRILDESERPALYDSQRLALLRQLGRQDRVNEILVRHLCPFREDWCVWCVTDSPRQGAASPGDGVAFLVHDLAGRPGPGGFGPGGRLRRLHNPNVTLKAENPLVVTDVVPRSRVDNYVEYETVSAPGPTARFRIRGAVLGSGLPSCVSPRLVFSSSGTYLGEVESPYSVTGRFEIELRVTLPDGTTAVTPRLTFDSGCLSGGQKLAFGVPDLAFGSRPR